MKNKNHEKEIIDRIFNQMIDNKRLSAIKPYVPPEEEYEYDPMPQGFPGQQWSKKLTEKQKAWVNIWVAVVWIVWIAAILKILL